MVPFSGDVVPESRRRCACSIVSVVLRAGLNDGLPLDPTAPDPHRYFRWRAVMRESVEVRRGSNGWPGRIMPRSQSP